MKYYVCMALPKVEGKDTDINWFITYTFGDNRVNNQYKEYKEFDFTVGRIYHTIGCNNSSIMDDSRNIHKVSTLGAFLVPFEFKLDKDAAELIKLKRAKGDEIEIGPYSISQVNGKTVVEYFCNCTVHYLNGRKLFTSTIQKGKTQREVIMFLYNSLRKNGKTTSHWRNYIYQLKSVGEIRRIYK